MEVVSRQLSYPFYQGRYTFRFDAKHRLSIPSRWLNGSNATEYFLAWVKEDGSLMVHPAQYQEKLMSGLQEGLEADEEALELAREIFNNAYRLDPDAQNRVRIDAELVAEMQFGESLVLAGDGPFFSIWNAETYQQTRQDKPFMHGAALKAFYNLKKGES